MTANEHAVTSYGLNQIAFDINLWNEAEREREVVVGNGEYKSKRMC